MYWNIQRSQQTNNGILLISGTINGERILAIRTPKKLPENPSYIIKFI
jgi:hypothetical protein